MEQEKVILWDLGRVFVHFDNRNKIYRKIGRVFGSEKLPTLFEGEGEAAFELLDTGAMSHRELWHMICNEGDIDPNHLTIELFSALYITHLQPIETTISAAMVAQKYATMFAVSNGDFGSQFAAAMVQSDYGINFQECFISMEHGVKKPELLDVVEEWLRQKYGFEPEQCIFIDDVPEYVERAHQLGMHGIVHDARSQNVKHLYTAFREFGLPV